jgi:periplasmic divalent cation tolerance protein
MTHFYEIYWTSGSIDEARKVARYLVQERLVACAQIIPWVESIYMWNNQLETSQESKVVLKAPQSNFDAIKEVIQRNSSYEVPEILYIEIDGGSSQYLQWLSESTPPSFTTS